MIVWDYDEDEELLNPDAASPSGLSEQEPEPGVQNQNESEFPPGREGDSGKIDKILEMVQFLKNKTSHAEIRLDKRMNKLKDAHNNLISRTCSVDMKSNTNEAKVASLEARLRACELERDSVSEKLEHVITRINNTESRADRTDREILDIVTEVKERKLLLTGVPEFKNEKIMATVTSSINKLINCANSMINNESSQARQISKVDQRDFEIAYRIGKACPKFKRNI